MKRCKFGRTKSGKCRKKRKGSKASAKKCRYGKLKHPRGRRICKKK